jgi:hypothetical protein
MNQMRRFDYFHRRQAIASKSTAGVGRNVVRYGLLPVTVLACLWIQLRQLSSKVMIPITPKQQIQALAFTTVLTPLASNQNLGISEDEANYIVRRAYERTAKILPCDENVSGEDCMQKTAKYFNPSQDDDESLNLENSSIPSIPWWFQTLLRDLPESGMYGDWHAMYPACPPMQFCTIPKVATTEWNKMFCLLNNDRNNADCRINHDIDDDDSWECWTGKCKYTTAENGTVPIDAPKAVIIRDPLERLLSSYLNKCH